MKPELTDNFENIAHTNHGHNHKIMFEYSHIVWVGYYLSIPLGFTAFEASCQILIYRYSMYLVHKIQYYDYNI